MQKFLAGILLGVFVLPVLVGCTTVLPIPIPVPQPGVSTDSSSSAPISESRASSAAEVEHATPEEAVTAYLEAIANADLEAVFAVSAPQHEARQVDIVAYVERIRAYLLHGSPLPANDNFLVDLNLVRLEQQLATQVGSLVIALLAGDHVNLDPGMTASVDAAWATDFAELMQVARLAGLRLTEITIPNAELMAGEIYSQNATRAAVVWGGDEWTERLAYFTFEGRDYALGFTLIRFGEAWYVHSQSSPIAGTPSTGIPVEQ